MKPKNKTENMVDLNLNTSIIKFKYSEHIINRFAKWINEKNESHNMLSQETHFQNDSKSRLKGWKNICHTNIKRKLE